MLLCLMMLTSCFSMYAGAATVYLRTAQTSASSSEVYGNQKYFYGDNSSLSAYSVYFLAKYKRGGIWYTNKSILVEKGESLDTTYTARLSSECNWKLKLNPEGAGHYGCIATGYIFKD